MENTRMIDDCTVYISSEVSVKREPLDEDVCSDVKYRIGENQRVELYVHPSLSVETCRMKQELLSTCNGEAFGVCTTVKREDASDSTLVDVVQTGNGSPFCKVETESVAQLTCSTHVLFTRGEEEKTMADLAGPNFHGSLPVSASLAADESPFPVALYQHGRIQSNEKKSYENDQKIYHHKIALKTAATKTTSSREIASDNVNPEHGPNIQKTDRCSACDHIRVHKRTPYECSDCSYSSAMNSSLVLHKPYKCSICDYSAAQRNSVVIHMRVHTGEKKFECPVCNLTFSSKKSHMRTHTGAPHKCTLCDYGSVYKSHLVQHMRTHTGEKPYKCSICDYSAAQKSTLVTHIIKTHTGKKP